MHLLKRERIKRHIYATRDDARADVVDYIEMFYNSKRRHGFNDLLSPVEYENKFTERPVSVWKIGGDSQELTFLPFSGGSIFDADGGSIFSACLHRIGHNPSGWRYSETVIGVYAV